MDEIAGDPDAVCNLARSLNERPQERTNLWLKHSGAQEKRRLCDERTGGRIRGSAGSSCHYRTLLGRTTVSPEHKVDADMNEQIERDIPRTGQERQSGGSWAKLRNVLTCYAQHNPTIGYCQSMNFIAAELLLAHEGSAPTDLEGSEECSFWITAAIVEDILTDYYDKHLAGLRADIGVAEELVSENLPQLAAHLEEHSVALAAVLVELLMTLGIFRLPRAVANTWWTCLFMWHHRHTQEGVAGVGAKGLGLGMVLALLERNQNVLLEQDDIMGLMHTMGHKVFGLSEGVEADEDEGYEIIKDAIRWERKLQGQGLLERQRRHRDLVEEEDKKVTIRRAKDEEGSSILPQQLQEWTKAVESAAGTASLWQLAAAGGLAIAIPIAALYGSRLSSSGKGTGHLKLFVVAGVLSTAAAIYANSEASGKGGKDKGEGRGKAADSS
jgi:hypothetical protein